MTQEIYVEKDCTIEHEGKTFESGGTYVSPDYAIGYLKFDHETVYSTGELTTWHGEHLGTAYIKSKWRVYSYIQ